MTLYRNQVVLHHASGLPRDNVTNTFFVDTPSADPTTAEATEIAQAIRQFFIQPTVTDSQAVMSVLGPQIVNTGHEVKVTPINAVTGHDERGDGFPPLWTQVFDLTARGAVTNGLPSEVAICLSYKSTESGSVPVARRRGRLYIGPIRVESAVTTTNVPRPRDGDRSIIINAAHELKARIAALGAGFEWDIYSRPYGGRGVTPRPGNPRGDLPAIASRPGALYAITDFWIDNAFDTMRKRGERATARYVL